MKMLIVEDDNDIKEILMFTFDSEISADYLCASSGQEATELIKLNDDIDLIVCDYNMPNGNGGSVYQFLIENDFDIPFVLCSSDTVDDHPEFKDKKLVLSEIIKPNLFEGVHNVLKAYENLLASNGDSRSEFVRNESLYTYVDIDLLNLAGIMPCEIYVKINDEKHLKILNQSESFSQEDLTKYKNKEIHKLLIEKQFVKLFVEIAGSKIKEIIECKEQKSETKVLDIHSLIMNTISSLGLSDEVINATEQSLKFTLNTIQGNKEYKEALKNILGHEGEFLTKHSIALVYITSAILSKSGWNSFENKNKLILASFFHDASIKVSELDEFSASDIENISLKNFKDHPVESVKLISKLKGIPSDLDRIILDHHERPDGSGKPRGISGSQIPPLSALFIFSHDIVNAMFAVEGNQMTRTLVEQQLDLNMYKENPFKKCLTAFNNVKLFEGE